MLQLFIKTLEELNQIHNQLSKVSLEKREALIKGDIDQLSELVKQESQLVRKIGKLEEERSFQLQQYGSKQGIKTDNLNFQDLLQTIPNKEEREKIESLTGELQHILGQLREQNDLNMRLTEDSLAYINQSIEVMTHFEHENGNYQAPQNKNKSGKGQSSDGQRFFDAKA